MTNFSGSCALHFKAYFARSSERRVAGLDGGWSRLLLLGFCPRFGRVLFRAIVFIH
jgi:hypothetical protein